MFYGPQRFTVNKKMISKIVGSCRLIDCEYMKATCAETSRKNIAIVIYIFFGVNVFLFCFSE